MRKPGPPVLGDLGVCITAQDGTVTYQNESCARLCGAQLGLKCLRRCLQGAPAETPGCFRSGFQLFRNLPLENGSADVVVVRDADGSKTILYDKTAALVEQLAFLEPYGLTRAELNIVSKFLTGCSHQQIAAELFISRATLRTHLNNLYKKIPEDLKAKILTSHFGKDVSANGVSPVARRKTT